MAENTAHETAVLQRGKAGGFQLLRPQDAISAVLCDYISPHNYTNLKEDLLPCPAAKADKITEEGLPP